MIFSSVAMTGLEKCCITSAYLQWLWHSGERPVARGPLVYFNKPSFGKTFICKVERPNVKQRRSRWDGSLSRLIWIYAVCKSYYCRLWQWKSSGDGSSSVFLVLSSGQLKAAATPYCVLPCLLGWSSEPYLFAYFPEPFWAAMWNICAQRRPELACTSVHSDKSLRGPQINLASWQNAPVKTLIHFRACTGQSESLLSARMSVGTFSDVVAPF